MLLSAIYWFVKTSIGEKQRKPAALAIPRQSPIQVLNFGVQVGAQCSIITRKFVLQVFDNYLCVLVYNVHIHIPMLYLNLFSCI